MRLTNVDKNKVILKKKLIKGIFEGATINTPSMICVEDVIDSLNWVECSWRNI